MTIPDDARQELRRRFNEAATNAKKVLVRGDRLRVSKCPGTKRWIIFDHWDGPWIVSKSFIDDYAAASVDRRNDTIVDFSLSSEPLPDAGRFR